MMKTKIWTAATAALLAGFTLAGEAAAECKVYKKELNGKYTQLSVVLRARDIHLTSTTATAQNKSGELVAGTVYGYSGFSSNPNNQMGVVTKDGKILRQRRNDAKGTQIGLVKDGKIYSGTTATASKEVGKYEGCGTDLQSPAAAALRHLSL